MSPPLLPTLPGLTWSRHKRPGFKTRVATSASGREVRVPLMAYPLYEFEAVYSGLPSSLLYPGPLGSTDLQTLMGFFLQMGGQAYTFLYLDPDDNTVTGQVIGIGDGSTTAFQISRSLGGFNEPVSWVADLQNVYLDTVLQPSGYTLTTPNTLTFGSAPGSGVDISCDFQFAFNCRFLDDQMDFEEFMSNLWKLDSMKFRSVKSWLGG
jgi:uncharacterized protein (TIGR02217 family)